MRTATAAFEGVEPIFIIVCFHVNRSLGIPRGRTIQFYLLVTGILGIIRTRTIWNTASAAVSSWRKWKVLAGFQTVSLIARWSLTAVLLLYRNEEALSQESAEERANILSTMFFWWINPLLVLGYRHEIVSIDLDSMPVHRSISVSTTSKGNSWLRSLYRYIYHRPSEGPGIRLAARFPSSFLMTYVIAVVLRMILLAVSLAQPFIISGILDFVQGGENTSIGVWLIIAIVTM